jgi:hypothetical protein
VISFVAESSAYITIRFEGPEIKAGRMRLDDLIEAVREFSACAKGVAMVLHQSRSTAKGRRPEELLSALSLDIVGFTEGSPAAVMHLERSEGQMLLDGLDFGGHAYRTLVKGIEIVSSSNDSLPPGFDFGVLIRLRDIGKLFNKGLARMEFTLREPGRLLKAAFDREKCDRIRQRIERPEAQRQTIEGRLLMADFKESARILRVHPPVGPAITCKFPENLTGEVQDCIRRFVRVSGRMQYHPSGEPQSLEIIDIEPLEETASGSPEWSYAFWENLSAEQYAERQGGRPIEQAESLYGAGDADDWEGFDEALEAWRTQQPT